MPSKGVSVSTKRMKLPAEFLSPMMWVILPLAKMVNCDRPEHCDSIFFHTEAFVGRGNTWNRLLLMVVEWELPNDECIHP